MEFEPLCAFTAPQPVSKLRVEMSPSYNRKELPEVEFNKDNAHETASSLLDQEWQRRLEANPDHLFNGTKFRLHQVVKPDKEEDQKDGIVGLQLGITDYKSCLGTNAKATEFIDCVQRQRNTDDDGSTKVSQQYLSQALGVEALVLTADDKLVLFQRSQFVSEHPGWYCCPGGHAEPSNVQGCEGAIPAVLPNSGASATSRAEAALHDEFAATLAGEEHQHAIMEELFRSIVDEVVAETGVEEAKVACDGLLGVVLNAETRKPDAIFLVRVQCTSKEMKAVFDAGHAQELYEVEADSEGLLFIDVSGATAVELNQRFKITPPSMACLELGLKML